MTQNNVLTGRLVSLHVLDYGLFRVHANDRIIGICGYLIRTDAGENVLVDTGFPAKYATDPDAATAEDRLYEFGKVLHCTPENLPGAQLARAGLRPDQIDLHILTHSHIDHVGGLHDFPAAPLMLAAAEHALPRPLYWGDVQPLNWPNATPHLITEDTDIGPGFRLLLVPGHAPGQLALLLDLPVTGRVLLTSDAISRPAEIDTGFVGSWDAAAARHSAARLMALAETHTAFVIYGHSPEQWPTLRKAPQTYR